MNLVGVGADGKPCTPVFTYAALSPNCRPPSVGSADASAEVEGRSSEESSVMKDLRESLERTGPRGKGGLEEARRRTGAPTDVSYAPAQLLWWLRARRTEVRGMTAATTATREGEEGRGSSPGQQQQPQQQQEEKFQPIKVWQTLPSLIAARWCRLPSTPVSYSEASWMGLLDIWKMEVTGRDGTGRDVIDLTARSCG